MTEVCPPPLRKRRIVRRYAPPGSQVLMLARDSYQLITICHHAGEYQPYPINILQSASIDLRKGLTSVIQFLREHP